MITMTFTWWGFILYFTALGVLCHFSSKLGERIGRGLYRRARDRKTKRTQSDTIAGQ